MSMEKKTGSLIVTKAADVGLDLAAIKGLMEARGIDTEKITPEVAASRFCRLVISTEDVDGIGDVVKSDGWDFSAWLENPALFADHNQTLEGTVARGLQAFVDTSAKAAIVDAFFLPPELDRSGLAEFVMGLYQSGMAKGISIGAIPTKVRYAVKADEERFGAGVRRIWERSKLLEASFVGVPMNSQALVARVAKSVSEGTMDAGMVTRVSESEIEGWSVLAKAALYAVKSANPESPPPPPVVEPPAPVSVVAELPPELKAMFEGMRAQIEAQGRAIKKMAVKSDVVHATAGDIQRAIECLGEAVEILAGLLPEEEEPEEMPPTQDDAVQVDGDKCDKSAPQYQRLVDAVFQSNHTKKEG